MRVDKNECITNGIQKILITNRQEENWCLTKCSYSASTAAFTIALRIENWNQREQTGTSEIQLGRNIQG